MAISIRYPTNGDFSLADLEGDFTRAFDRSRGFRLDRDSTNAFGSTVDWLNQQGGGQPMSLASLGAPVGQVTRAPLDAQGDKASARVQQAFSVAQGGDGNVFGRFMRTVRDGGLTNPNALAAVAATGKHESSFSPKNAFGAWDDPSQSGQAGRAGGILSWRAERLDNLRRFAAQNGDNPNAPSPEVQAKFLLAEDPQLIQRLQQARSPDEAQQMMNAAWRFAGYDQPGGEAGARVASARQFVGMFGDGAAPTGGQQALESLAVGENMQMPPAQVADASGGGMPATLLPPSEVMKALFANPNTREFAMGLAQAAQKVRANANDPMAQLEYRKALLELRQLQAGGGTKPTDDMREYEFARSQGFEGTFQDWQLANRKAGATNVNVGGGDNKQIFDTMNDSAVAARAAVQGLAGLSEAKRAVDAGIISGAGADIRLGLQKLGAFLGVSDPGIIENTETFRAAIAPQVAAVMKATVGSTQISNADREFAERAAGGSINLDASSIERLIGIMDKAARVAVESHRKRLDAVYPDGQNFGRERALFDVLMPDALPTGRQDRVSPSGRGQTGSGVEWSIEP